MIEVLQGDIVCLEVDAIVNAANNSLLGGGGVDGAIHRAAGPRLREYSSRLGGCPTGGAKISPGFDLLAQFIVHTVGPVWHGGNRGEPQLLDSCYRSSMQLALENEARSIAFPSVSTGAYRYPRSDAATIAIAAMRDYEACFERIVCCCFSAADAELYRELLEASK